jgi:hypothetical protein
VLQLTHTHTDTSGAPDLDGSPILGVQSDVLVAPLTCDAACRASSGDAANPGFIADEICLYQSGSGAWACIGYRTDPAGVEQYFVWYAEPGKKDVTVFLDATPPSPDEKGVYPHALIYLFTYVSLDHLGGWEALIQSVSPNHLSEDELLGYDLPFTAADFQPTAIQYTQFIAGTSGATAGYALFTQNYYSVTVQHPADEPLTFIPKWQPFAHNGVLGATGTATSPGYAGWSLSPTKSATGGSYYVYCCTATLS